MNNFDEWNVLKQQINKKDTTPYFKDREIWWCSLGQNIGHEENGKNNNFERPVLVLKKFNKKLCWAVPLTTQIKDNIHYYKFNFKNKSQCAMLTQLRIIDTNRFTRPLGRLGYEEFKRIKSKVIDYLEN